MQNPLLLEHTLQEANKMLEQFRKFNPSQAAVKLEDIHAVPIGSGSIAQVTNAKSNIRIKAVSINSASLKVHRANVVGLEHDAALNVFFHKSSASSFRQRTSDAGHTKSCPR